LRYDASSSVHLRNGSRWHGQNYQQIGSGAARASCWALLRAWQQLCQRIAQDQRVCIKTCVRAPDSACLARAARCATARGVAASLCPAPCADIDLDCLNISISRKDHKQVYVTIFSVRDSPWRKQRYR